MVIDCKQIKSKQIEALKAEFAELDKKPKLQIIVVGSLDASQVYVRNKKQLGEEVGVEVDVVHVPETITEAQLIELLDQANSDKSVDGLFVQLPVPEHISEEKIINRIAPEKDVDGFSFISSGKVMAGVDTMNPCTADAVITILNEVNVPIEGSNIVIAGRSNIVGKPLANLLINMGATVTVANSKTKNIKKLIDNADVFISAIGRAKHYDQSYFENRTDLTIIDVGINRDEHGKLCGDVDFTAVAPHVKAITPVPGGVGVLTVVHVMKNMLKAVNKEN
ncbi:bifunctional 5,10-methylenetetrahydrofolate dehydrogenase/5,10-methenyltetrahydrofolate cyclohydrolase [Mollicutes bacterium LVI A0039]|nr:bifunctional 5,10-methylenetetrahydrofolate dehydrogenase/5,10-methenyltetrahydrofolate cyclohydrolase [Mollicutes bacterium LVI A0039]